MERYAIRGGRAGYDRLLLLARERQQDTADLFRRAGVGTGMHCLDLGCGGGEVTLALAELISPHGRATGADVDEAKLELARRAAAERGHANVEFRAVDVTQWNELEAYDVVYCRFLLQHLSDPVDLLRRMWAAVRPGGVLIVEDADFDGSFCDPPDESFDFHLRTYRQLLERRGADATVGRKLHRYFRRAGITGGELNAVLPAWTSGECKTLALSTLEATADAIRAEGLATDEELNTALDRLAAYTADPDTLIGGPRIIQIWSRRPSPQS